MSDGRDAEDAMGTTARDASAQGTDSRGRGILSSPSAPQRRRLLIGPGGLSPLVTYMSTCCAVLSVLSSLSSNFRLSVALVVACGILDSFDGRFASMFPRGERALRFGVEVDSLSDVVAFGVAPATLVMSVASMAGRGVLPLLGFVCSCAYVVAAVHRLAWYGTLATSDDADHSGFRGVPVTYSALAFLFAYLPCVLLDAPLSVASCVLLAVESAMAFLFVWDVPVPRPRTKVLAALAALGVVLSAIMLLA